MITEDLQEELISIIVPVYNVETYVFQCLASLQRQTYAHIEVIMINDGSTDRSGEICREFTSKDKRFVLYEQENRGLGAARNVGVEKSHGDYLCFVDSDDYVHPQYVEVLYQNLKRSYADISMCGHVKVDTDGVIPEVKNQYREMEKIDLLRDLSTFGPGNRSEKLVVVWNKLIRGELMRRLSFVDKLHEDEFMINQLLVQADKMIWTDAPLYCYRQRSGSIMSNSVDIRHLDILEAYWERQHMFRGQKYRSVRRDMAVVFFENARYWYDLLQKGYSEREIKKRILPIYGKMYLVNVRYLSGRERLHYLKLFMILLV